MWTFLGNRERDQNPRSLLASIVNFDFSFVLMNEMAAQVQAQASALLLGSKKGGKYFLADLIGNTRAIVSYEYFNGVLLWQRPGLGGNECFWCGLGSCLNGIEK